MKVKLKYLMIKFLFVTLVGIMMAFSIYTILNHQQEMFNDIDKICNNTNKTIIYKYDNIDCHRWNLRNYTMI